MSLKKIQLLLFIFMATQKCGRPPGDYSGLCSADCSNSLIATDEMTITNLVATQTIRCNAGQTDGDAHAPFPIRFLIQRPSFGIPVDGEEKSEASLSLLPATAISYDYQLLDGVLEGPIDNFGTSCTDSCGTGILQLTPTCGRKDNDIRVLIQSGPISQILEVTVKGISGAALK